MTESEILRLYHIGSSVQYIDGEGSRKVGECIGWSFEAGSGFRNRVMLVETSTGHEKRVPLTHVLVVRQF